MAEVTTCSLAASARYQPFLAATSDAVGTANDVTGSSEARQIMLLEVQLVALPRVFNLSKREADMAIGVSRPEAGRLTVQKLTDYRLHLAASRTYLAQHPPITTRADLGFRCVLDLAVP